MSSPAGVRHRGPKEKIRPTTPNTEPAEKPSKAIEKAKPNFKPRKSSEWDYRIAISIITILAFVTRFWGINFPSQVVFDEVHFGKVWIDMRGFIELRYTCHFSGN
jgi:dolichyl-phosphate-mannose-protein mannosyltransferase